MLRAVPGGRQPTCEKRHASMVENPGPTTNVLLVDGNAEHRQYWANQLKTCSAEYVFLEARDGQSGLALYKSQPVDCVVVELDLPDMSGFSFLVKIVERPQHPEIAVIILTHLVHSSFDRLAKENGAQCCLTKSHTSCEELHRAIQRGIAKVGPRKGRLA